MNSASVIAGQGGPWMFQALAVAMWALRSLTNWKLTRPKPAVITTTAPIAWASPNRRTALKSLVAIAQLARLFRQHDRHAVADRISEAGRAADQLALGAVV